MRILMRMLTIVLFAAWGPVAPAQAQCEPSLCSNPLQARAEAAKPKPKKMAAKKAKKPKAEYMRAVPF